MIDRDTFAAAALTGLLAAPTDKDRSMDYWARLSYEAADAMLARRQCVTEPMPVVVSGSGSVTPVPYVKHDEKRVDWHTAGGTNHDAAPAARANAESVVPQPTAGDRSGNPTIRSGTGDSLREAEIDAIQHVVEDGRIVKMQDYGALRSLLVRLRPEWEDEDDSDRSQPINDERLAALEGLSALDQELELSHGMKGNPMIKPQQRTQQEQATQDECTKQGECGFRDSRKAKEPVAWLVKGVEYDTGCEYEYVTNFKENAEAAVAHGGCVVPLYCHPRTVVAENATTTLTDAEREAVGWYAAYGKGNHADTLRGLLERLK